METREQGTGNSEQFQELGRKEFLPKVQGFQVLILKYLALFEVKIV
ncbi:MAG: hypothetical protein F6K62_20560 [Sphaerospermopsis sp. SIO1G2]|nr:hypothetical protein [Sphaerospermopsis sp. SIO1G1]NET73236.1 hypothetical protein [Sphaerospermopsis sp. SIO1G2]